MSEPIYLLVMGGYTEAWHRLSEEEQASLSAKVEEVDKRAGAKWIVGCNSRWADEAVAYWAVIEYPDIGVYLKKVEELEQLGWFRYFVAKTILGTKMAELG